MKLASLFAAACCLAVAGCASPQTISTAASDAAVETRAQVMVLGVYHFTPGGSDYVENRLDDHLSPRRQAEIAQVLDLLERFRPTKIALELDPADEARFNERYQRWLAGQGELGVNERDQLGMALARRLGHDRLYSADASSDMHFDEMLAAAQAAGQNHLVQRFHADMAALEAQAEAARGLSVRDRLISVNSPEYVRFNGSNYLTMAQMGTRDNSVALRDMTAWLGRNLSIFAQVAQLSEPGDRILLIYGAGHKFLLDQYFSQANEFELVDPLTYLR